MKWTEEEVKKILLDEIKKIYGVDVLSCDENLLNQEIGIPTVDFLYLFSELEKNYDINICSIIARSECEIFTINNLAKKIIEE